MKEYEIRGGKFAIKTYQKNVFLGMSVILILYSYVHSLPYLFVCGDDRIIYYPGADDLTGEPGDA